MTRRFRAAPWLLFVPLALGIAACGEQPSGLPDTSSSVAPETMNYATPCSTADINALIDAIFERPAVAKAFKIVVNGYIKTSATGPRPQARAKLFQLVDQLLKLSANTADPVKRGKIQALVQLLYCILGEEAPPLDLVNGGAAVITPTTGATVAARCTENCNTTGANDAATKVDPGALPANVTAAVVSIVPITTENPLDTPLRQSGPFYEFTVTPNVTFAQPVLVGVCLNKVDPETDARIRLAHNLSPDAPITPGNIRFGNIEIISPAATLADLNLDCDPLTVGFLERAVDFFLPEKLFARGTGTGGRGGLVSNYSPFGGVVPEPLTTGLQNWLFEQPSIGDPTPPSTVIGAQTVSFFENGGVTTPSTGAVWQGPWAFGQAPFGETESDGVSFASQCNGSGGTVNYALGTASLWKRASAGAASDASLFTYLYARRVFYSANTTDKIQLLLDNDVRTWINGVEVTEYVVNGQVVNVTPGSFLSKEGCAKTNQVLVAVPRTGINVISVQARDRGVASYFDATQAP